MRKSGFRGPYEYQPNRIMIMNDNEIICCAQLLYGGIKEYHAVIIQSDIFPGTGDYEDPVEVQEDKEITCYQVLFEDLVNPENYNSGRTFLQLEEARQYIESVEGFICWL